GDKADLENVAGRLTDLAPDKGEDWSTEGARKAAALLARTFFTLQGVCLRTRGPMYLAGLGIQLLKDKEKEDYRLPVLPEGRAEFKNYLDRLMAVRQLNDNGKKNGHVMYADALAAQLKKAVTDLEVLEIFGMNLAYVAWDKGYKVKIEHETEKTIWPDLPSLVGEWEMVERIAQPQDDPDYPGFVVAVWKRGKD